jgi:hypothetical protein
VLISALSCVARADPYPAVPFMRPDGDAARFASASPSARARRWGEANKITSRHVIGRIVSNAGAIRVRIGGAVRERKDQFSQFLQGAAS